MREVLVLGFGNTLRRDDAAGPLIAETVSSWNRRGVRSLALPQLVPELAEPLSRAHLAIFVDAIASSRNVQLQPLAPTSGGAFLHHTGDPAWLLSLALAIYRCCPPAWLITVPADDFGFGEGLSPKAQGGMKTALRLIEQTLNSGSRLEAVTAADGEGCRAD